MKLSELWRHCTKKVETKHSATQVVSKAKGRRKKKRYVNDKWGNRVQAVEVKTPRKIAKRITSLATEMRIAS